MTFTKLTDDSSWLIETSEFCLVIDPWFTEKQVDFSPWFSLQSRKQSYGPFAFPKEKELLLFISHPFSDHCHKETLLTFPKNTRIFAERRALKKIRAWQYFDRLASLDQAPFPLEQRTQTSLFNQTHHAFSLHIEGKQILYAPHGVKFNSKLPQVDLLITTITTYKLPLLLGGTVNLGLSVAEQIRKQTNAKTVLTTHDQQKDSHGLVGIFAKPSYEVPPKGFIQLSPGEFLTLT